MLTSGGISNSLTLPPNVVAALFHDSVTASDAIADLRRAGFGPNQIGVALSREARSREIGNPELKQHHLDAILHDRHSWLWTLRRSFEHDLHSLSVDLTTGEDTEAATNAYPPYSEVELGEALRPFGVSEDRIDLLDSEIELNGLLMLVDAGSRTLEVQKILERNRGNIRTEMATEATLASR